MCKSNIVPPPHPDLTDLEEKYVRLEANYKRLMDKYEVIKNPVYRGDGIYVCPSCNHRVHKHYTHCHWCGQKLNDVGGKQT